MTAARMTMEALGTAGEPGAPLALVPPGTAHPRPYLCRFVVEPGQAGAVVGHVSNVEYVRWLDRAAELHADRVGHGRRAMLERQVMWFVARHEIDYCAECWPGEEIVIATWVRDMARVRSWRDTIAWRPADGVVVMRAASLWVYMDLASRRPRRVPADDAARFDPLSVTELDHAEGPSCASA